MIAFDDLNMAIGPCALQVEVVGALAPDMPVADMILDRCQFKLIRLVTDNLRRAARETGGIRYSLPTGTCRDYRCQIARARLQQPDECGDGDGDGDAEVAVVPRQAMLLVGGLAGEAESLGQLDLGRSLGLGLEPSSDRHST